MGAVWVMEAMGSWAEMTAARRHWREVATANESGAKVQKTTANGLRRR